MAIPNIEPLALSEIPTERNVVAYFIVERVVIGFNEVMRFLFIHAGRLPLSSTCEDVTEIPYKMLSGGFIKL